MSTGSMWSSKVSRSWFAAAVLWSAALAGATGCDSTEPAKEGSRALNEHVPGSKGAATGPTSKEAYLGARSTLIENDRLLRCGARQVLSDGEAKLNDFLARLRDEMIARYKQRKSFPPAEYFPRARTEIESTRLFKILKRMPKGGALHIHTSSTGRASWLVDAVLSRPNCYVYWEEDRGEHVKGQIGFYRPGSEPPGFRSAQDLSRDQPNFRSELLALLTLGAEDAAVADIWEEFDRIFQRLHGLLHYQPVFMDYYHDAFRTLLADNVQYVELRAGIGRLHDLSGGKWTPEQSVALLEEIRGRVRKENADFDLKLILAYYREADVAAVWDNLQQAVKLRAEYPDFVIGYDLVGEEDTGHTTLFYLEDWLKLRGLLEEQSTDLPFYFHDGESDWPGDRNLYDAYLLKSGRIGHGFALFRTPQLEKAVIEAGIALEVCPVSNQVLRYVRDLRMHPAAGFLNRGVPCVISSDDPAIFGTEGLSYDYWEALMAWDLDLRALKQLARNSLVYSGMNPTERQAALAAWQRKWDAFVRETLDEIRQASP